MEHEPSETSLAYSVVLPAYREDESLRVLLPRLRATMNALNTAYEILVVDAPEPLDSTPAVCLENEVRHVPREPGATFGDAIRTGIDRARGERIIFMDADGSHPPEFIEQLVRHQDEAQVVIASRYVDGGHTENPAILIFMSRVVNLCYSLVLNIQVKDVSNSFRLYDAASLKSLTLKCENFDIVEEILFKLKRARPGIAFKEVPFSFRRRMFGQTKRNLFRFMLSYVFTIVRLRFMR